MLPSHHLLSHQAGDAELLQDVFQVAHLARHVPVITHQVSCQCHHLALPAHLPADSHHHVPHSLQDQLQRVKQIYPLCGCHGSDLDLHFNHAPTHAEVDEQ